MKKQILDITILHLFSTNIPDYYYHQCIYLYIYINTIFLIFHHFLFQMQPSHIEVNRCDGSCHHQKQSCLPTRMRKKKIPVSFQMHLNHIYHRYLIWAVISSWIILFYHLNYPNQYIKWQKHLFIYFVGFKWDYVL